MTGAITAETLVTTDSGGETWTGPWGEFVASNPDLDDSGYALAEIGATVARGETYRGGGGAEAAWTVARA
jgi:hypothetical protein